MYINSNYSKTNLHKFNVQAAYIHTLYKENTRTDELTERLK